MFEIPNYNKNLYAKLNELSTATKIQAIDVSVFDLYSFRFHLSIAPENKETLVLTFSHPCFAACEHLPVVAFLQQFWTERLPQPDFGVEVVSEKSVVSCSVKALSPERNELFARFPRTVLCAAVRRFALQGQVLVLPLDSRTSLFAAVKEQSLVLAFGMTGMDSKDLYCVSSTMAAMSSFQAKGTSACPSVGYQPPVSDSKSSIALSLAAVPEQQLAAFESGFVVFYLNNCATATDRLIADTLVFKQYLDFHTKATKMALNSKMREVGDKIKQLLNRTNVVA